MELMKCTDCDIKIGYFDGYIDEKEIVLCLECMKSQHKKDLGNTTCMLTDKEKEDEMKHNDIEKYLDCIFCGLNMHIPKLLEHIKRIHGGSYLFTYGKETKCPFCLKHKKTISENLYKNHIFSNHPKEYTVLKLMNHEKLLFKHE